MKFFEHCCLLFQFFDDEYNWYKKMIVISSIRLKLICTLYFMQSILNYIFVVSLFCDTLTSILMLNQQLMS
jgi:hypothetical protein